MMKITKDLHGIVINTLKYKTSDLIVDVFCLEYGFMQLYVRGAQKTTSKSFYIFQLFNIITFDLSKLNLDELSIYKSGSIEQVFDFTNLDYDKINIVMFVNELLNRIKRLSDNNYNNYYQDITSFLSDIHTTNPFYLLNWFLYQSLVVLGCQPTLDCCVECNKASKIVAFDLINNGFICQNCFDGNSKYLTDKNILNYLYKISTKEEIANNSLNYDREIFRILLEMINENAGVYLESAKYIY
ncbi:DNA repair protein RecO [Erysipelotrichaceae bacterium OttesenSCG-928-M19]|nr:DNA repair protein RecO [Erysipelotrichaceae bacterium OttesenSCG-928-M19]